MHHLSFENDYVHIALVNFFVLLQDITVSLLVQNLALWKQVLVPLLRIGFAWAEFRLTIMDQIATSTFSTWLSNFFIWKVSYVKLLDRSRVERSLRLQRLLVDLQLSLKLWSKSLRSSILVTKHATIFDLIDWLDSQSAAHRELWLGFVLILSLAW